MLTPANAGVVFPAVSAIECVLMAFVPNCPTGFDPGARITATALPRLCLRRFRRSGFRLVRTGRRRAALCPLR